jgi:hypothetical protein
MKRKEYFVLFFEKRSIICMYVCMYVCICVANLIAPPLLRLHYYLCFMKLVSSTMLTAYLNWL